MTKEKGKLIVVSAASGAGKTTLLDYLRKKIPELVYSISATTRKPRAQEKDGVHYFFLSKEEFEKKIDEEQFIEWAKVHDNYYGTPKDYIINNISKGITVIMDVDVQGKQQFDKAFPENKSIFIKTPSHEILEKRLRDRGTDDNATIGLRLKNAAEENTFAEKYGKYDYYVVNDALDVAQQEILAIVNEICDNK